MARWRGSTSTLERVPVVARTASCFFRIISKASARYAFITCTNAQKVSSLDDKRRVPFGMTLTGLSSCAVARSSFSNHVLWLLQKAEETKLSFLILHLN